MVVVRRLKVVRVALKLGGVVTVSKSGWMEGRWATSGMIGEICALEEFFIIGMVSANMNINMNNTQKIPN